jgi:hypothetical protein
LLFDMLTALSLPKGSTADAWFDKLTMMKTFRRPEPVEGRFVKSGYQKHV